MKLAVCGAGYLALKTALHFYKLGADVTLFAPHLEMGGMIKKMAQEFPDLRPHYFNFSSFSELWTKEIGPLVDEVQKQIRIKPVKVIRVQKRFLGPQELVSNSSRLIDLFRVVYTHQVSESVKKEIEENEKIKEMFKNDKEQFGEKFLESLNKPMEAFEDFDLVLNCTGPYQSPMPIGPGGQEAINEKAILSSNEWKNLISIGAFDVIARKIPDTAQSVIILGDGQVAALALIKAWDWLKKGSDTSITRRMTLVTTSSRPFENLVTESPEIAEKLETIFVSAQALWEKNILEFEKQILKWKELEDYIKAKTPRPLEPVKQFDVILGANVTCLDCLIDRSGLFVTVERPEFRDAGPSLLTTLACDLLFVGTGHKKLRPEEEGPVFAQEPGLYTLSSTEDINIVEKNILSYFSRA